MTRLEKLMEDLEECRVALISTVNKVDELTQGLQGYLIPRLSGIFETLRAIRRELMLISDVLANVKLTDSEPDEEIE